MFLLHRIPFCDPFILTLSILSISSFLWKFKTGLYLSLPVFILHLTVCSTYVPSVHQLPIHRDLTVMDEVLDDLEESGRTYDYRIHGEMYIPCKSRLDRRCRQSIMLVTADARSMCYNIFLWYSRRRRQAHIDSFGKINILSWSCQVFLSTRILVN
ncbi:hypothetical protein VTN02DRAFT_4446 [Thermoascus thermophilus]